MIRNKTLTKPTIVRHHANHLLVQQTRLPHQNITYINLTQGNTRKTKDQFSPELTQIQFNGIRMFHATDYVCIGAVVKYRRRRHERFQETYWSMVLKAFVSNPVSWSGNQRSKIWKRMSEGSTQTLIQGNLLQLHLKWISMAMTKARRNCNLPIILLTIPFRYVLLNDNFQLAS